MPQSKSDPTILEREIFREGWSIDERAWHPTFINQVVENTKLLMKEAGVKPLVLPDHPPEDPEKAEEWFSKIKSMGHAIDLMVKLDKEGKIVLGGKLKLTPSFSKEYEEEDYPSVSIGIGPSKMLPSGKRVGPHIDHIAIFGHKHAAMSDLASESEAQFVSHNFSPRHKLVEWQSLESPKREVFEMDPEKMGQVYELLMKCAEMLKPSEGGGEGEVVIEEEMEGDEPKKDGKLASTEEDKKEELAAEDDKDKKEEMNEKYESEAFSMALSMKADQLSIPQAKRESFTAAAAALHKQHKGDVKKTFKELDTLFSGMQARPSQGGVLKTPAERKDGNRVATDDMYDKYGLDGVRTWLSNNISKKN